MMSIILSLPKLFKFFFLLDSKWSLRLLMALSFTRPRNLGKEPEASRMVAVLSLWCFLKKKKKKGAKPKFGDFFWGGGKWTWCKYSDNPVLFLVGIVWMIDTFWYADCGSTLSKHRFFYWVLGRSNGVSCLCAYWASALTLLAPRREYLLASSWYLSVLSCYISGLICKNVSECNADKKRVVFLYVTGSDCKKGRAKNLCKELKNATNQSSIKRRWSDQKQIGYVKIRSFSNCRIFHYSKKTSSYKDFGITFKKPWIQGFFFIILWF